MVTIKIKITSIWGKNHNHIRYLDVNIAANKSGPQKCAALTRFHALTGCDIAFNRKG